MHTLPVMIIIAYSFKQSVDCKLANIIRMRRDVVDKRKPARS
jgi:hypothetical protein